MSQRSTDIMTAAQTVYGEARGEPFAGKLAVAWVIRNRADDPGWWGGPSWKSVCLKPWQFSCWNENDPNRPVIEHMTSADFLVAGAPRDCLVATLQAAAARLPDPTHGATHYVRTDWLDNPKLCPQWAGGQTPVCVIGAQSFFRLPS